MATIERILTNSGDTITKSDGGQPLAITERRIANAGDAITDGHGGQVVAIIERKLANGGDGMGNANTYEIIIVSNVESSIATTGVFWIEAGITRSSVMPE